MIRQRRYYLYVIPVVLLLISFALMLGQFSAPVSAEVLPAETQATQPPPTATYTPTLTEQATLPPQTVVPTPRPLPPAEIPEPITVILFGTGLAALSAAAALLKKAE